MALQIPKQIPRLGFYHHYKHDDKKGARDYAYEVMGVGFHTESDCRPEDHCMVMYRPLYESAAVYQAAQELRTYCYDLRPIGMFMEDVPKGPNGEMIPRFKPV